MEVSKTWKVIDLKTVPTELLSHKITKLIDLRQPLSRIIGEGVQLNPDGIGPRGNYFSPPHYPQGREASQR